MMESFENQDFDKSQSRQFPDSHSQMVSAETCDKAVNKNIEDLKKFKKTDTNFDEIYATPNQITNENDFHAINFAVKEKFHDVKNKNDQSICERSMEEGNSQLARLIIEFDGSSNYDHIIPKESDFSRFIVKIQHFDAIEILILTSKEGHLDVVKLLLTVPTIDVNAKDKDGWTSLIYASYYGHHEVVKLLLTVPGIDTNGLHQTMDK